MPVVKAPASLNPLWILYSSPYRPLQRNPILTIKAPTLGFCIASFDFWIGPKPSSQPWTDTFKAVKTNWFKVLGFRALGF